MVWISLLSESHSAVAAKNIGQDSFSGEGLAIVERAAVAQPNVAIQQVPFHLRENIRSRILGVCEYS
jgi:hypothetical protein